MESPRVKSIVNSKVRRIINPLYSRMKGRMAAESQNNAKCTENAPLDTASCMDERDRGRQGD